MTMLNQQQSLTVSVTYFVRNLLYAHVFSVDPLQSLKL